MKILVTGGAGSLGKQLLTKLLENDEDSVIVYDNNENAVAWLNRFNRHPHLKLVLGDVNDSQKLDYAMTGVDVCVHLAYAKHVDLCESDPLFGLKTNIDGTMNTVSSALRCNVSKFLFVSSDKAVNPVSIYGKSKSLCESIVLRSYHYCNGKPTIFSVVRPPNYMGSNCSVLEIWKEQKLRGEPLTVTDSRMMRYFMSFTDMTKLIVSCIKDMTGGELFVPTHITEHSIMELAHTLSDNVVVTGTREGERLSAYLMTEEEQCRAVRKDDYWLIK